MKVTVIGASGQIGTKVVALLNDAGQQTVAASRGSGADVLTGEGLREALAGADVLVDVVNSPSFDDAPALNFFTAAARNLVEAAAAPASVTMSHCPSWVPTVCPTAGTCGPRWPRNGRSSSPGCRTRSSAPPSFTSSPKPAPNR